MAPSPTCHQKSLKLKPPFCTLSSGSSNLLPKNSAKTRRNASVFIPIYFRLRDGEKRRAEQKEKSHVLPLACVMLGALSC